MDSLVKTLESCTDEHELHYALLGLYTEASDLVSSRVVREGYLSGGHSPALGFQHLNTMTKSRIKKRYPFWTPTDRDDLSRALWVSGRMIVARALVKKYTARKEGDDSYDYKADIDNEFDKLFADMDRCGDIIKRLNKDDLYAD